ncbi:AAA family ATPase [Aliarcobacter butzleri]|uniref:AAA family ATPase n=1 Tax=Aliarcobacter butzleri TaxID=28197 RepID=UPI002B24BD4F|nr:AAA family ATPase [Aliarcobacter butzleri]
MELVYLWVQSYKNIEKQGFNFSPRFRCEYDEEKNELTINENKDYVSIFPDNINITAIVGENGSGKSSILEILQKIFIFNPITLEDIKDLNYLLVINTNLNLNVFSNISNINYLSERKIDTKQRDDLVFEEIDFLFYDASLPYNEFNKYNVASANFIYEQDFNVLKEHHFIDLNIFKISEKLLYLKNKKIEFDFFKPICIKINLKTDKNIKRDFFVYDFHRNKRFSIDFRDLVDTILDEDLSIYEIFLFNVLLSYCDVFKRNDFKNNLTIIKNDKNNRINNMVKILDEFYKSKEFKDTLKEYGSIYSKKTLDEIINLCKVEEFNKLDIEILLKYVDYIDIELFDNKGRTFSSLSHGEKVNFAIQVYINFNIYNSKQNMFYIFDEPDLSLHPEWQRKYFVMIIPYMKQFKTDIHLIITSHSPFLLSDLSKENVIFLEKDEKTGNCINVTDKVNINPFGANIHTLLSHGFFMKDGLIGEFAKDKIQSIIKYHEYIEKKDILETDKSEYKTKKQKEFWQIQSIIGDDYLKQVIKNHLIEIEKIVLGNDEAKHEEVKRLKAQIELLEK